MPVVVERCCGAPSYWITQKSSSIFLPNKTLSCVGISPTSHPHPYNYRKRTLSPGPGVHPGVKRPKVSNPKHIMIITLQHYERTTASLSISGNFNCYYFIHVVSPWPRCSSSWTICCPCPVFLRAHKGNSRIFP